MNNPIFSSNGSNNSNNGNNLLTLINQVRHSGNPQQAMQNLMQGNPQFNNVMNYINQNGGDAKTAFYNLAAQKGVDPESILSQLR